MEPERALDVWMPATAECHACGTTRTNFEDQTEATEWLQEHECADGFREV